MLDSLPSWLKWVFTSIGDLCVLVGFLAAVVTVSKVVDSLSAIQKSLERIETESEEQTRHLAGIHSELIEIRAQSPNSRVFGEF